MRRSSWVKYLEQFNEHARRIILLFSSFCCFVIEIEAEAKAQAEEAATNEPNKAQIDREIEEREINIIVIIVSFGDANLRDVQ